MRRLEPATSEENEAGVAHPIPKTKVDKALAGSERFSQQREAFGDCGAIVFLTLELK